MVHAVKSPHTMYAIMGRHAVPSSSAYHAFPADKPRLRPPTIRRSVVTGEQSRFEAARLGGERAGPACE